MRFYAPSFCDRFFPILVLVGLLTMLLILLARNDVTKIRSSSDSADNSPQQPPKMAPTDSEVDLNEYNVKTHKGYVTLQELNEKVFKQFGYEIKKPTLPVPTLRMLNEPTCDMVPQPEIPPKQLPV
ncbi:hypothetical protein CAEBREN_20505, partial [Caenorhabditis brenneri]